MSQFESIITAPCLIPIHNGLKVGHQILIRGRVSATIDRFSFNLKNGDQAGADIAFHFNPREPQKAVVRNTFHNGSWGVEERAIPSFEFDHGSTFSIRVLVKQDCYSVFVNGKHYIDYNHRLDMADVRFLHLSKGADYDEAEVRVPVGVPFSGKFGRNFQRGDSFRVRGVVLDSNPDRFAIDLKTDTSSNIAFHFNPRYSQRDVVMNTKTNGSWGTEQRGTWNSHFEPGKYFDVYIVAHLDHFDVSVNDEYFTTYHYRLPVTDICCFGVHGDVMIMEADFGQNMDQGQVKALSSPLEDGDVISVQGWFHGPNRFHINLLNGTNANDDVAVHFNPRRTEQKIVFNTKVSGWWQREERIPLPDLMKREKLIPFFVDIVYLGSHFHFYLDGHRIYTFNNRNQRPVTGVHCVGESFFYESKLLRKLNNPFVDQVPKSPETGNWVSMVCMPHANSDRFAINLQDTNSSNTANSVHFHFNPRFVGPVTVCNTFTQGWWGAEQRKYDDFPFSFLERYEVKILVLDNTYRVFVDGEHYLDYPVRLPRCGVSHIRMDQFCDYYEPNYHV